MTDYSSKIRDYLNENYTESYTDSDGNEVKYFIFSSNYFVKLIGNAYYICEKSGADEETDIGRLNFYLPSEGFTKNEIAEILGVEPTCNDHGIVE